MILLVKRKRDNQTGDHPTMEKNQESLGERLIRIRTAKGWTQDYLAKQAGVGQSTIASIEKSARAKIPGSLIDIAHALGIDAYYLKYGIQALVAGDKMIDRVVELMRETAREGKAIVLDKAMDAHEAYPKSEGKQQKSFQ